MALAQVWRRYELETPSSSGRRQAVIHASEWSQVDVECDNWPLGGALYVTNWRASMGQRVVVCELERLIAHVGTVRALQ